MFYKTYNLKTENIKRKWHLINAKGKILGRLASQISQLLIGKNKETYTPHIDAGDFVVVINAKDVKITGKKEKQKVYFRHSGYPGGLKKIKYEELKRENPEMIIRHAVSGMLPKNRLKKKRLGRLKVFFGAEHPFTDKFKDS